jgi:dTDP-4-amino-4,6-dideoxygalactose transaminase
MENLNFLPEQYKTTGQMNINHCYLQDQFSDYQEIFKKIENLVQVGDYTLGKEVDIFEQRYADIVGTKYAIGVGSGTDALFLSLKALGIDKGDEVITTAYTFFATIGAIVTAGATPVFVDVCDDYNIDPEKVKAAITSKTKAILPVHWSGYGCQMDELKKIANEHGLFIVEDACHGIHGEINGQRLGSFGDTGCFSMHPLKNLNVWGDGGVITTNNPELYKKLALIRNHGLINRDQCQYFAYNSRLDTLQAIVANHLLDKIELITESRIKHAKFFDEALASIPQINIPPRNPSHKHVYHIYVIRAERRDELQKFLIEKGVDAKIHYPIPMHLQPAAKPYGYKKGDIPNAEKICDSVISLPVHEFINREQQEYVVEKIKEFYR